MGGKLGSGREVYFMGLGSVSLLLVMGAAFVHVFSWLIIWTPLIFCLWVTQNYNVIFH